MAQMKEQIKTPKIELSDEEIANIPDAEFKTLVIRILTEGVEYSYKIEEEVKAMQSGIKIYREPTIEGRKPGLKSTVWNRRKKETSTRTEWRNKNSKKK